jgi:hypothetical protein
VGNERGNMKNDISSHRFKVLESTPPFCNFWINFFQNRTTVMLENYGTEGVVFISFLLIAQGKLRSNVFSPL